MELADFQRWIAETYLERDTARGELATLAWLIEEVGELAKATRRGSAEDIALEMSDVLAWLATLANQLDIDLAQACERYRDGCPKCGASPCVCDEEGSFEALRNPPRG